MKSKMDLPNVEHVTNVTCWRKKPIFRWKILEICIACGFVQLLILNLGRTLIHDQLNALFVEALWSNAQHSEFT